MMNSNHNYALDFVKFIAILMVTNSHLTSLYQDVNPTFATLGVHGNSLFFFASGFALALSASYKKTNIINWYKNRLGRILPTIIVWAILSNAFFYKEINWKILTYGYGYWFISCILVYYILLYFILKYAEKRLNLILIVSCIATCVAVLSSRRAELSIYHKFHYVCYFSSMVLGSITSIKVYRSAVEETNGFTLKYRQYSVLWYGTKVVLSFIIYFAIMAIGKGKTDSLLYYTQLVAMIPLLYFTYCFYFLAEIIMNSICSYRHIVKPIVWLGSLCLEAYVVQGFLISLISSRWNVIFPLNIVMTYVIIFFVAYLLKICSELFRQIMNKNVLEWHTIVKL